MKDAAQRHRNALAAVWEHDLSQITRRMVEVEGMAPSYAAKLEKQWRMYLIILLAHPGEKFPMSAPVDQYAHNHILFTRNFHDLCEKMGGLVHHEPTFTDQERAFLLTEYREKTMPAISEMFGELDQDLWPPDKCVCRWDLARA